MKNYRITNLKTNIQHFMNEEEKERFLKINNRWYYFAEDMQTIKAAEKQKKKDNILFYVVGVCLMTALYLTLCEILNAI